MWSTGYRVQRQYKVPECAGCMQAGLMLESCGSEGNLWHGICLVLVLCLDLPTHLIWVVYLKYYPVLTTLDLFGSLPWNSCIIGRGVEKKVSNYSWR